MDTFDATCCNKGTRAVRCGAVRRRKGVQESRTEQHKIGGRRVGLYSTASDDLRGALCITSQSKVDKTVLITPTKIVTSNRADK